MSSDHATGCQNGSYLEVSKYKITRVSNVGSLLIFQCISSSSTVIGYFFFSNFPSGITKNIVLSSYFKHRLSVFPFDMGVDLWPLKFSKAKLRAEGSCFLDHYRYCDHQIQWNLSEWPLRFSSQWNPGSVVDYMYI